MRRVLRPCGDSIFVALASILCLSSFLLFQQPHDGFVARSDSGLPEFELTLCVITYNRLPALIRLLNSLHRADYAGASVSLAISVDAGAPTGLTNYVHEFLWPHGKKHVHVRIARAGLLHAVVESWFPSSPNNYGLLLEDDLEVSPYYYAWLRTMHSMVHASSFSHRVFGISLYTPRVIETTNPFQKYYPDAELPGTAYLHQLPCSWGALQFPGPWMRFHTYMSHRLLQNSSFYTVPGSRTNGWTKSWKKFYIEFAHANGLFMVYPNFPNQTSFSTNHLESGVHIHETNSAYTAANYTVPLHSRGFRPHNRDLPHTPVLDVMNKQLATNVSMGLPPLTLDFCSSINPGYTGLALNNASSHPGANVYGNKMLSGSFLPFGFKLVSTPQRLGEFAGFFFVGTVEEGAFVTQLFDATARYVRTTMRIAGDLPPTSPLEPALLLTSSGQLQLVPASCANESAGSMPCSPWWQATMPSARHDIKPLAYTLHLRTNGDLVVVANCGCDAETIWSSNSAVDGFVSDTSQCNAAPALNTLLPGKRLSSHDLNTLLSDVDSSGHYVEAVMQPDGNFVLYSNPSATISPVGFVRLPAASAAVAREASSFALVLADDGNLRALANIKNGTSRVLWATSFHGMPLCPHFLALTHQGLLQVYEGYGVCDSGRMVWDSNLGANASRAGKQLCPDPVAAQHALTCSSESRDIYLHFSDPDWLTIMITVGWQHTSQLQSYVQHLVLNTIVSCIIVRWQQPFTRVPPNALVNGKFIVHVHSVASSDDLFYPSQHVTTQAVLSMKLPHVLYNDEIAAIFHRWAHFPGVVCIEPPPKQDAASVQLQTCRAVFLHKQILFDRECGTASTHVSSEVVFHHFFLHDT